MANQFEDEARELWDRLSGEIERNQFTLLRIGAGIGLVVAGAALAALYFVSIQPDDSLFDVGGSESGPPVQAAFTPPPLSALPEGADGEAIKRGLAIFDDTARNAGQFVGNSMACKNCHLDSGRRANSSPMWAAWLAYPQYRNKDNAINTMHDRIKGCFRYSMNAPNSPSGEPPPDGSDVYRDLEAYFHWLATGAPTGEVLPGAGYPRPQLSEAGYDPGRGSQIFQQKCTGCHGVDGQGARQPDGKVIYPPLWGPRSYNWGAGMARVDLAAGFIRANMPFDQPGTLTDQEAWDVAAFVDSHERPKDPRQTGSVAENAKANFAGQKSFYGQVVGGNLLGTGVQAER